MKAELYKAEKYWTLVIIRKDSRNDYRFRNKQEAKKWAKSVGIEL